MMRLRSPLLLGLILLGGLLSAEDKAFEADIEVEVIELDEAIEMRRIMDQQVVRLKLDVEVEEIETEDEELGRTGGNENATQDRPKLAVSHLQWDQDSISTSQAEAWLNEHEQPTRIVGASDEQRPFTFTSGSYWQAISALCETFQLSIDPPPQHARFNHVQRQHLSGTAYAPMGGGRVTLRPRAETSDAEERWLQPERALALLHQPSGIFLLEVIDAGIITSSDQETYLAGIAYRLRCEPGLDLEAFAAATISFDALLTGDRQRLEWPEDLRGDFRHRLHSHMRSSTQSSPPHINIVAAQGSDSSPRRLLANGSISANRLQTQEYEVDLEADGETTLTVKGNEWRIRNRQKADDEGNHFNAAAAIEVSADSEAGDDMSGLRVLAKDDEGNSLLSGSTGTSRSNREVSHRVGINQHEGTVTVTLQVTTMDNDEPVPFSLMIDLQP